jgi:hypothetical protein
MNNCIFLSFAKHYHSKVSKLYFFNRFFVYNGKHLKNNLDGHEFLMWRVSFYNLCIIMQGFHIFHIFSRYIFYMLKNRIYFEDNKNIPSSYYFLA